MNDNCCAVPPARKAVCPVSGTRGRAVGASTLDALLQPEARRNLVPEAAWFCCDAPNCDAVFAFDAIHHTTNCTDAVREMLRVCRPGGLVAVGEMNAAGLRVVEELHRERGEHHETNGCRADAIYRMLAEHCGEIQRLDQEFETLLVARPDRARGAEEQRRCEQ